MFQYISNIPDVKESLFNSPSFPPHFVTDIHLKQSWEKQSGSIC